LDQLVIDSSVTVSWFIPEERDAQSQILFDRVTEDGAVVPIYWPFEVGNALLLALRRRRITTEQRSDALVQLVGLQITIDRATLDHAWSAALDLADRFGLTLYDACYLELAQRRSLPLATFDKELNAAGRRLGLPVLGA
jgi:predicted nucleic acid-binding protein